MKVLQARPTLTLAGVFDRTTTAMGGRLLRRWLHRPLRNNHSTARIVIRRISPLHRSLARYFFYEVRCS